MRGCGIAHMLFPLSHATVEENVQMSDALQTLLSWVYAYALAHGQTGLPPICG